MFHNIELTSTIKQEYYPEIEAYATSLFDDNCGRITNLANCSALLYHTIPDINWVGFYLLNQQGILELGPFQGLPACTLIAVGKGVCGTAVSEQKSQLVPDVHLFTGHIACDSASNSEIVIPLRHQNQIIGVFDIDSPTLHRFDGVDQEYLERIIKVLEDYI